MSISRRNALAALATLPLLPGAARAAPANSSVDGVKALVRTQQDAWNRGDIAGFCALYAEDCIFLSPSGVTHGRQVVLERFTKKYGAARETMGRLNLEVLEAREGAAMVTLAMRWSLTWEAHDSVPAKATSGHTLIVWQRQAAGWRLVQDASM